MSSRTPCRFFLAGNCRNGSRCNFHHEGFSSIPAAIMADATGEETSVSPGHRTDTQASASTSTTTRPAYAAVRPCQWYMAGYCLRGDSCWFSHDRAWFDPSYRRSDTVAVDDSDEEDQGAAALSGAREDSDNEAEGQKCAICFEEPSTFGLLVSCNHAFCLTCIRTWRSKDIAPDIHPQDRNGSVTKACPNCRTPSLYIVPSSYFPTSPEQKENIIRNYKEATARRPCKHFKESGDLHWCPFGDSCFFAHQDENGEPCKVNPESDPRRRRRQQRSQHHHHHHHTHFGGTRNRNFTGRYQPRAPRNASEDAFELLHHRFLAGLADREDASELEIEGLRVLLTELARPLRYNHVSLGDLDVVDLDEDEDEFDDDGEDDEDDWEDEEDEEDDEDEDEDEDESEVEDDLEAHYRFLLQYHPHLHHHDDF